MVPMSKIFVGNCTEKAAEDAKIRQNKIQVAGSKVQHELLSQGILFLDPKEKFWVAQAY